MLLMVSCADRFIYPLPIPLLFPKENNKRKPGWVALQPGSILQTAIDIDGLGDGGVTVAVTYLSSWEHMGQVNVSCISGCTCEGITVVSPSPAFWLIPKDRCLTGEIRSSFSRHQ